MILQKLINGPADMAKWKDSQAYFEIVQMITWVNRCVISFEINDQLIYSKNVSLVKDFIRSIYEHIEDVPLEETSQRFGNKAFKTWFDKLNEELHKNLKSKVFQDFPDLTDERIEEASGYFSESLGNSTRIDYGTGHELAFIAFLVVLFKLEFLSSTKSDHVARQLNDYAASGLIIMPEYLRMVRKLQTYFKMEPAGSHGVWCLDDYQFVPFIWGTNQLVENTIYSPASIDDKIVAEKEKDSNLFFGCIHYIYQVKTGPFSEHSNILFGLTQLPSWQKINGGMMKMYRAEVLEKFPVVQHFKFGKILTLEKYQK